jgi:hypothetical protein
MGLDADDARIDGPNNACIHDGLFINRPASTSPTVHCILQPVVPVYSWIGSMVADRRSVLQ